MYGSEKVPVKQKAEAAEGTGNENKLKLGEESSKKRSDEGKGDEEEDRKVER